MPKNIGVLCTQSLCARRWMPLANELMKQISVGLSSWIIQDGNYDNFQVGQERSFALEFYPHSIKPSNRTLLTATNIKENCFQVWWKVIYQANYVLVVDV